MTISTPPKPALTVAISTTLGTVNAGFGANTPVLDRESDGI